VAVALPLVASADIDLTLFLWLLPLLAACHCLIIVMQGARDRWTLSSSPSASELFGPRLGETWDRMAQEGRLQ